MQRFKRAADLVRQDFSRQLPGIRMAKLSADGCRRQRKIHRFQHRNIHDAVSGAGCGKHNRFMVGDIKQSIYGFRNARPELFLEKAHSYMHDPEHSSDTERAGLRSRNFRSRLQVLDAVNLLFRQLMQEKLGGIVYDDDAALYPGASYPEPDSPGQDDTELILVETLPADDSSAGLRQKEQRVRAEARAAAAQAHQEAVAAGTEQLSSEEQQLVEQLAASAQ